MKQKKNDDQYQSQESSVL